MRWFSGPRVEGTFAEGYIIFFVLMGIGSAIGGTGWFGLIFYLILGLIIPVIVLLLDERKWSKDIDELATKIKDYSQVYYSSELKFYESLSDRYTITNSEQRGDLLVVSGHYWIDKNRTTKLMIDRLSVNGHRYGNDFGKVHLKGCLVVRVVKLQWGSGSWNIEDGYLVFTKD